MPIIQINQTKDLSINQELLELYKTLKELKWKKVDFDLSNWKWVSPFFTTALAAYIKQTNSKVVTLATDPKISNYLETIGFPLGATIPSVNLSTFIPISILQKDQPDQREKMTTQFLQIINTVLNPAPGSANALSYPVAELIDNVFEHSKKDFGFIFGQYYKSKNFLEICICDTGRGIAGSYFQEEGLQLSDTEAIQKALAGDSTKSSERGYGIRTSIKVVCEGLGGQFCLLSGNSFVIANSTQQYISHFPDFSWKGTIITYRIPRPQHKIDIYGLIG